VSVIIPVLNAGRHLAATLAAIGPTKEAGQVRQIIVVDGGSKDDSRRIAQSFGAHVVESAAGRGRQMRLGATLATAPWLLFLHADTVPDQGWFEQTRRLCAGAEGDRAGVFQLRFDDTAIAARLLERGVALRTRALGLPYGDQALLISRRLYDAVGGYRDMPLMEDVDLVRRIGRRRIALLDHRVTTSAERYRRAGYAPRILRNLSILTLYLVGVSPQRLAKLYG
jgi:rSAM/selenodomain-associated transferase 2